MRTHANMLAEWRRSGRLASIAAIALVSIISNTVTTAANDQPISAGVRLTQEDHQRHLQTITMHGGIQISDWVWENYAQDAQQLEQTRDAIYTWLSDLPEEGVYGIRPPDEPPTLAEMQSNLSKDLLHRFNRALLKCETAYWNGLAAHQVREDVLTELRQETYRRHLLAKNRRFAGANVDVITLLDIDNSPGTLHEDLAIRVADITHAYAAEMMTLLLDKAKAETERVKNVLTMFELGDEARRDPPLTAERIERSARPPAIEGQIARRNAACIAELQQTLSEEHGQRLEHAWRMALYPFLWNASLESRLAKVDKSSPRSLQALATQIHAYQQAMHERLWQEQNIASDFDNQFAARRDRTITELRAPFRKLRNETREQIAAFIAKFDELKTAAGDDS